MKKKRFLFSLLMAIVMMAMSPQKVWADDCENCSGSGKETCDYCYGSRKENCEDCQGSGIEGYCIICSGTGKENCDDCSGSGKRTCEDCQGSGKGVECGYCEGTGYDGGDKCSHCGGSGYNACDNCGGSGKYDCDNCSGSGKYTCHNCGGRGGDTCSRCDGSGKQTCTGCSGSGGITCYLCDGSGKVAHAHQPLTEHPAVDATLASDGNSAYWSCSECGKYFNDAEGKNEIAENSWVIAKTTNISLGTRYIDGVLYYEIGSAEDMLAFRTLTTKGSSDGQWHMNLNAILTADIVYDGTTKVDPIGFIPGLGGDYSESYTGIFDGNKHTIKNLRVSTLADNHGNYCHALFASLNGATIKDLYFEDMYFVFLGGYKNSGLLAMGAKNSTLTNIFIGGSYLADTYCQGGCFVGRAVDCTFTNCDINCGIDMSNSSGKGAAGMTYECQGTVTFTNCYFYGSFTGITASNASSQYTAPFYYSLITNSSLTISNSYAVNCQTSYDGTDAKYKDYKTKNPNITYKEPSAFTSGEVAYLLNRSQDAGTWRQKLSGEGVNTTPVLKQTDDNKVYYGYANCAATEKSYANSALHATQGHSFTNYTYNNDATCVKNGTMTASCDNGCGTTDTKDDSEHPATGIHSFGDDDPGQTFCTVCHHTFFRYTAEARVTPVTKDNLKNASGQSIYVDSQNTFNDVTKEGVMEFNEPLTEIGDKAFTSRSFTGSLVIPNSVTSIGGQAFEACTGFTGSLTIPNSVTSIGGHAFQGCAGFTGSLTIPNSVTSIGVQAFAKCSNFTGDLVIPNAVKSIGDYAFWECVGFTGNLTIGSSVESIGNYAFKNCAGFKGNLTIGSSVESIGEQAFYECSGFTGDLVIPNSVKSIGEGIFNGCAGFKGNLTIGSSVESIGKQAFNNCNFSGTLDIPASVTSIGNYGLNFGQASSITDITVHWATPSTVSLGNYILISKKCTLHVPGASYSAYKSDSYWKDFSSIVCIDHSNTSVQEQQSCTHGNLTYSLCSVCGSKTNFVETGTSLGGHIMDSTNSICTREGCGHGFFHYNTASGVIAPKKPENLKDADGNALEIISNTVTDGVGEIEFNKPLVTIGQEAFTYCQFTGDLVVPSTVTTIDMYAFGMTGLSGTITLPASLKSVGTYVFTYSSNIQTIAFRSIPQCNYNYKGTNISASVTVDLTDQSYIYAGDNKLGTVDPTYRRTNIKNKWGTLVVPFDVLADQEEYDLYSIIRVEDEELTLKRPEGILPAGTPVLIRMSEAGKDPETGMYTLHLEAANTALNTTITNPAAVDGYTLKGSYDIMDITEKEGYIISNNAFWNIQTIKGENKVYNAPFRAYLEGSTANCAKMLSIGWNDDEDITAVETLDALTSDEAQYFDINGRKLNDLQKGINIVKRGNKTYKIIVK